MYKKIYIGTKGGNKICIKMHMQDVMSNYNFYPYFTYDIIPNKHHVKTPPLRSTLTLNKIIYNFSK